MFFLAWCHLLENVDKTVFLNTTTAQLLVGACHCCCLVSQSISLSILSLSLWLSYSLTLSHSLVLSLSYSFYLTLCLSLSLSLTINLSFTFSTLTTLFCSYSLLLVSLLLLVYLQQPTSRIDCLSIENLFSTSSFDPKLRQKPETPAAIRSKDWSVKICWKPRLIYDVIYRYNLRRKWVSMFGRRCQGKSNKGLSHLFWN